MNQSHIKHAKHARTDWGILQHRSVLYCVRRSLTVHIPPIPLIPRTKVGCAVVCSINCTILLLEQYHKKDVQRYHEESAITFSTGAATAIAAKSMKMVVKEVNCIIRSRDKG